MVMDTAKKYFMEALDKTILTKDNAKKLVKEIVNEERVSIEVEHKDMKNIANKMEKSSERVTLGLWLVFLFFTTGIQMLVFAFLSDMRGQRYE